MWVGYGTTHNLTSLHDERIVKPEVTRAEMYQLDRTNPEDWQPSFWLKAPIECLTG